MVDLRGEMSVHDDLVQKVRAIEGKFAGGTAGDEARQKIKERLAELRKIDPPIEHQFTLREIWARFVFLALAGRYGLKPYRYKQQRDTTVLLRESDRFVSEIFGPLFDEIHRAIHEEIAGLTNQVVRGYLYDGPAQIDVVSGPHASDR